MSCNPTMDVLTRDYGFRVTQWYEKHSYKYAASLKDEELDYIHIGHGWTPHDALREAVALYVGSQPARGREEVLNNDLG